MFFFSTKPGGNTLLFKVIPSIPPTDAELDSAAVLTTATALEAEAQQDPEKKWFQVTARLTSGDRKGVVVATEVDPAEPPKPEPLDTWSFIKNCTLAARVTNAGEANSGLGINRDFMIAYSLEETGTKTASVPQNIEAGGRNGPFSLTADQWKTFVDSAANTEGFQSSDIRVPVFQCYGFAFMVLEATKKIIAAFVPDLANSSGPRVPSTIELFVYLAMGETVAFLLIKKLVAGSGNETAHSLVNGLPDAAAILSRYTRFFGAPTDAVTISGFEQRLADSLDASLKRSFTLVREHTPEDIIYLASGTLPWMVKAREEQMKGVAEQGAAHPNPEIIKYFTATALSPAKEVPWCGAFVAWCLMHCGSEPAAKSVRKASAATAASWKTWGDVEVPIGAHENDAVVPGTIVILRPQTDDASGHVGFFVSQTSSHVVLLAGNQSDSVRETTYPRKEVVAMRSLKGFDAMPAVSNGPGTVDPNFPAGTLGPFTATDWATYTQVLGHSESGNNYTAVNPIGFCGRWQFGADALIDGGYIKMGATTRLLKQLRWWTGKDGIASRDDWLANKIVQDTEMINYTRRHYKSLLNIKATRPFIEKKTKAQLAGLLATAHLLGAGGARNFVLGQDGADAFGTTASKYYKMMSNAFGGAPFPPAG